MMNRGQYRTPSPLISRTSTVLFNSIQELRETNAASAAGDRWASTYGTHTTPTTAALEEILVAGEGGAGVELAPSGLAAITTAFVAMLKAGDHLLVTDSAYGPARRLADGVMTRMGVEVEYYDPLIAAGIAERIRPNTTAIWLESPGTHTFEIQDIPAIVAAAKAADHRVVTAIDNTWGSPGILRPFDLGVDISVVALTKYWSGHSDVLAGATFANAELLPRVREAGMSLGMCLNGEDAFLLVRGARTVDMRLAACGANSLVVAGQLQGHRRVGRVLHPALPTDPGHALFTRDFHGTAGLFAFEMLGPDGVTPGTAEQVDAFTDRLVAKGRFGLGYSWGGHESLVMPARWSGVTRSVRPWTGGQLVRLNIGLEDPADLWADLAAALDEGDEADALAAANAPAEDVSPGF